MPIRIEAYTLGGIVTGMLDWPGHLRDALETNTEVQVERPAFTPLDGSSSSTGGTQPLVVDDIVFAVPDEPMPGPVHAAWHAITLDAGPYQIEGELATLPGFDPERALARPSGTFVLLRDVSVSVVAVPEAGTISHPQGLVNRYNVDAVEADLMLGFFFPGARMSFTAVGATSAAGTHGDVTPVDGPTSSPEGSAPAATA